MKKISKEDINKKIQNNIHPKIVLHNNGIDNYKISKENQNEWEKDDFLDVYDDLSDVRSILF